jgi:surfeit locus 1 family protein
MQQVTPSRAGAVSVMAILPSCPRLSLRARRSNLTPEALAGEDCFAALAMTKCNSAMTRRSLLAPTLFTTFGLVLLVGLGTWQVERLHWKEGLIVARAAAMTGSPASLPTTLAAARALDFHRVRAGGRFVPDHTLYLYATNADGAAGYHVLTPFALDGGATVIVDRGFVPTERKNEIRDMAGAQAITGILRLPSDSKPGWFTPANQPERGQWFWVDLPAMAKTMNVTNALAFYVDEDVVSGAAVPVGGQTVIDLPNNHLQYAITWYALAVALVVVYIILIRRRPE